jgi:hypothetical protein
VKNDDICFTDVPVHRKEVYWEKPKPITRMKILNYFSGGENENEETFSDN